MRDDAFEPVIALADGITIAATSARKALPAGYNYFRLHNKSTEDLYIRTGDSTVEATVSVTGNLTLGPGAHEVLKLRRNSNKDTVTHIAAIGTSASGHLTFVPGEGL